MKTIEVQALKTHQYDGRERAAGTRYNAEEKDVHVLQIAGLAVKVAPMKTRETTPSQQPDQPATPTSTPRYNRRDMRAQD
jgi:hypothetical protein